MGRQQRTFASGLLGVALALGPRWQRTCRPPLAEAIIVVRLATPAALALLLSLPRFPLRSNIWHAGSRERWQGTVVVLAQCNYQGRSNYSFKGNADVSDFQTIIRRRVPLIQALDRCSALPSSRPARLRTSTVGPSAKNFRLRLVGVCSRTSFALAAHVPTAAGRGDYVS